MERLDLLYKILKGLEKHYTDYHNKPSEGLEPKMIEEITGKIYDVCQEHIELKTRLEKEAQAREEEELEHDLQRQLSGRPVLRQQIARSHPR